MAIDDYVECISSIKLKHKDPLVLFKLERRNGYSFGNNNGFYDVFWRKISNHYVIMEEFKTRRKRDTTPLEVREVYESENSVDERCLSILRSTLVRWGYSEKEVQSAKIMAAIY